MNELWGYLVENSQLVMWTAISASLLTSANNWRIERKKVKKVKDALITPAPVNETLSVVDYEAKSKQENLDRLMKIHGIDQDKAVALQDVIDQQWAKTVEEAQKEVNKTNVERLARLN